jgi:predicted metal-dependent hydrolase
MTEYIVKKSKKARKMRITIRPDATISVTIPHNRDETIAHEFVKEKRRWIERKLEIIRKRADRASKLNIPKGSKKDLEEKKDLALAFILSRLNHFNKKYGLQWNRVYVKHLKTRWGSCSQEGNLNFSYKVIYLPKPLADYLIVHELCHLKEFHHGNSFWNLVEKTIPNYETLRTELRSIY